MCGICGIIDFSGPPDPEVVGRMTATLTHRGPDDSGLHRRGPAALGFRRLSIIDLAGSPQPMSNEDDSIWLVFNGEIYNYRTLRKELLARGHAFKTAGDGETILHLYEEHGLDFVDHLNGMFAIALWDSRSERLVLARDRLGIKPLYYARQARRLLFASETKALLGIPGLTLSLDPQAIAAYMNYSTVPDPMTCFKEIRRLEAGHVAVFDRDGLADRQYWDVRFDQKRAWREPELLDALDETLKDSVRLRMISDVPFGVFLSGGVDSSVVGAMMCEASSGPVEAFSIGFGEDGAYMNELHYAEDVAKRYGMKHHTMILRSEDLLRDVDRLIWHLDEPCGDNSAFLTLAVSEFARKRVTVTLSGLGGDELFGGYRRYLAAKYHGRYLRIPSLLRNGLIEPFMEILPEGRTGRVTNTLRIVKRFMRTAHGDIKRSWANATSYLPAGYPGAIFANDMRQVTRASYRDESFEKHWARVGDLPDPVDQAMYMDTRMFLTDTLLLLQDRTSMAVSLEARVPFLDHRVVELAATIPASMHMRGPRLKCVLKKLAERYVPMHCIYREKKGFASPLETWLREPLREQVYDALSPERIKARGIFDVGFTEWLKEQFYGQRRDLTTELSQVYLLEVWMRLFVDGAGRRTG